MSVRYSNHRILEGAGTYINTNNALHAFQRNPEGALTLIDASGAGTGASLGTTCQYVCGVSLNQLGAPAGAIQTRITLTCGLPNWRSTSYQQVTLDQLHEKITYRRAPDLNAARLPSSSLAP